MRLCTRAECDGKGGMRLWTCAECGYGLAWNAAGDAEWGYRTRAGMTAGEAKCDYVIKLRGNDGRRGGMRLCARAGMMAGVGNAATHSRGNDGGLPDRYYAIALISSLA